MNLILLNWVKYYTKELLKTLRIVLIGCVIVLAIFFIKYKPAYKVTFAGEELGYVENKDFLENRIKIYMSSNLNNVAFRELSTYPEYSISFVSKNIDFSDDSIMLAVEKNTVTTYKMYALISDGEQKAILTSNDDAQNIISEIEKDIDKSKISMDLAIAEIYTTNNTFSTVDDAKNILNEVKSAKLLAYKKEQEAIAAKKAAELKAKSVAANTSVALASLGNMPLVQPVVGSISSRFGTRSSSRSSIHTGLDIASKSGTGIRPISSGKVIYAGWKGTYGNLIIIDHGNGIVSYYAHCNSINVTVGQMVDTNTVIGTVGSTGNSTGPHLHLEIRVNDTPINPQNYLYR